MRHESQTRADVRATRSFALQRAAAALVVFGAVASAPACPEQPNAQTPHDAMMEPDAAQVEEMLPQRLVSYPWSGGTAGSPGPTQPPPPICEWAASNDVVVVGTLADVVFVDEPMIQGNNADFVEGECETAGAYSYAMNVVLKDVTILYLAEQYVDGSGPQPSFPVPSDGYVSMRVSYSHRWQLRPIPIPATDAGAGLDWQLPLSYPAFVEGNKEWVLGETKLGLAARHLGEFDAYVLMGEAVFMVEDGRPRFQPHIGVSEAGPPVGAEKLTVEGLEEFLQGCERNDASAARAERFWRVWGPGVEKARSPEVYYAAYCHAPGVFDEQPPVPDDPE